VYVHSDKVEIDFDLFLEYVSFQSDYLMISRKSCIAKASRTFSEVFYLEKGLNLERKEHNTGRKE